MSLIRDPVIITAVGHQMMTAGGDITYTKATLYGQDISHLTKDQLESLTSIGNPLLTVPVGISDKSDNDNATTVVLEATFQNSNLKADLPYSAVGFFAKKGNDAEKLVVVGVANPGAYLVATPPDGVATDALDIKVAIAIGDATSVTAVVDPAGSVTPATLNGVINKLDHDLTARIDVKADKTTVESALAAKANQSDLDQTNAEVAKKANSEDVTSQLATKANSSDVAASVKSLTDSIATKADAKTVNDAISKIDFTPYAKTADVDSKLQGYTNTADLTKLLDVKANAVDVYSKTELDKKLLALSTDTDGKVNVDQVSSMIANKVDKSDLASDLKAVNDSIATKANTTDVNTALTKKDDTTDVDAKIKTVIDLANTKANVSDVYTKKQVDDALSSRDTAIATKADKATVDSEISKIDFTPYAKTTDVNAELAGKANKTDIYTKAQVDTALAGRDSSISNATHLAEQAQATADRKDDVSDVDKKVKSVSDKLATKANASDVYTKSQTDGKLGQKITFVKCDSPQAAYEASTKPAADGSIVFGIYDMNDEPSEAYVAGQKINIEWLYNHFNDLQSTVNNGLATKANQSDLDTTNATVESQATEIASLKAQLNDAVNQINYIKANYIEGKRFAKSQEVEASAWENANPQRIAFITDD